MTDARHIDVLICLSDEWPTQSTIVSLDGSWSCPGNASGSRINHSLHCPDGRQTTFEEAFSKHRYYLTKSGTCMRAFHVAQVPIHRDIITRFWCSTNIKESRYAFVQLRWIWGCPVSRRNFTQFAFHFRTISSKQFSVQRESGYWHDRRYHAFSTGGQKQREARDAFWKMKQNTKSASVGSFIPTHISTCCTRST